MTTALMKNSVENTSRLFRLQLYKNTLILQSISHFFRTVGKNLHVQQDPGTQSFAQTDYLKGGKMTVRDQDSIL